MPLRESLIRRRRAPAVDCGHELERPFLHWNLSGVLRPRRRLRLLLREGAVGVAAPHTSNSFRHGKHHCRPDRARLPRLLGRRRAAPGKILTATSQCTSNPVSSNR